MDNDFILKVNNLNVALDNQNIIENLSFSVNKGDIITILGPNGAGKTVLLKCLLSLLPYHGEINWKKDIKIGYVPQRLPFIKDIPMSVMDFFILKNISKKIVKNSLTSVGLKESLLDKKIGDLSSGQFQRILITWSLINNPQVLLFDEPTSGIDIKGEETIYQFLKKLKVERQLTIILVTHDLNVVYEFSNCVICLNKKAICSGAPNEVLTTNNLQKLYSDKIKFYRHKH